MFVSQAHSFQQQARLAVTLAWVAGYTNILTFLTCETVTSHVSGTSSNLGRDLTEGSWGKAGFAAFLLINFCAGAAIASFCLELGRRRRWESIYVLPIGVEAALLALFAISVEIHNSTAAETGVGLFLMTGFASLAMGLQNATITHISGGTVRTTHVTGVLTDFGMEIVHFFWIMKDDAEPLQARALAASPGAERRRLTLRRLALLGSVFGTFILGAALGTWAFGHFLRWAMFPPAAFLAWLIYQDLARPIAEILPSSLVGIESYDLPPTLSVFHLHKDHDRRGKTHRMPNLLAWSERLPITTKVVILDLGEVNRLDANAAMELRAVLTRFAAQGRQLVIAGVSNEQFRQLSLAGTGDLLRSGNVCPDLELAIARGLSFLDAN